jgi:protein-S-isoprenylcysteine O-methyltransferase Ste14
MNELLTGLPMLELGAVGIAWVLFAIIFLVRRPTARAGEQARDRRALIGLLFQIAGYSIVRLGLRRPGNDFLPLGPTGELLVAAAAIAILAASLYLAFAAVQTLGRQWSLAARLIRDHQLVDTGPYAHVRHPIYTSMLGMLIGTALAVSSWPALLAGSAVLVLGTVWRIHVEEQLLLAAFGDAYRRYSRAVPAFIPRLGLGGKAAPRQEPPA